LRCKIFTGKDAKQLEEKVNKWFEQSPRLEIIYVAQSYQPRRIAISIFYDSGLEKKEDLSIS